jgi:cellulose synthase/poly-beta-1,6-N-acetylglucosamine synthase-like glycosyltransferase
LHVLELIAYGSLAIFFAFYLSYLGICLLVLRAKAAIRLQLSNELSARVSIIIPTFNEAKVIQKTFDSLREVIFPKERLEVVFVDSGSTDGTLDLLRNLSKDASFDIRIVSQKYRKGFNSAIIEAFDATSGDVICITGAEIEYDPSALNRMLKHFTNPEIGAVTGRQRVRSQKGYSPKLEVAYRELYDIVREAESKIDSTFDIKGEISASRRSVMAHLVKKTELSQKGAIDTSISFQAKIDHYRTVYEPEAVYYELPPGSVPDSIRQQTRRAATLIQNMLVFKGLILNRNYGYFGMLIVPAHFLMLVILPLILSIGVIGVAAILMLNPYNYLLILISGIGLAAIALSPHLQAFLKTQLALLLAAIGLLIRIETQKFERIESTRT